MSPERRFREQVDPDPKAGLEPVQAKDETEPATEPADPEHTEKADVKAQAKEKVEERKEQLRQAQEQAKTKLGDVTQQAHERPVPAAAIAGGAAVVGLLVWLRRRRR